MSWFIFSEVMFFAGFFGALFYARNMAVPWLGGSSNNFFTNLILWPEFEATWPTNGPADVGGEFETIPAFGIPALNTMILLTSGAAPAEPLVNKTLELDTDHPDHKVLRIPVRGTISRITLR